MSTSIFFEHLVQEDRVHRSIYTDPLIFELEMTHIFGGVWCYLAHESQLPRPDDYITAQLGLRPLIVVRDSGGKLRALFNRCTHRGARVCRETRGNARTFQCPYHGWTYFNSGKLRGVPWPEATRAIFPKVNTTSRRCRASRAIAASSSAR
jgi:phenylpropionate dioxygenase-like ring-hydroxylating dioxygenase large terminal subunit